MYKHRTPGTLHEIEMGETTIIYDEIEHFYDDLQYLETELLESCYGFGECPLTFTLRNGNRYDLDETIERIETDLSNGASGIFIVKITR